MVKRSNSLAGPHQTSGREHETLLGQPAVVSAQRTGAKMGVSIEWVKGSREQIGSGQVVKEIFDSQNS